MQEFLEKTADWFATGGVWVNIFEAAASVIIGYLLSRILVGIINRMFSLLQRRESIGTRRISTYISLITNTVKALVFFLTFLQVLSSLRLTSAVTAILATAGIGTVAISFCAQNLVKDIISGLFMLWENQYSVGDYVQIGAYSGYVEEFRPRITVIRANSGELHTIPNGSIAGATNYSRGNNLASVDIAISSAEDPFRAIRAIEAALANKFPDNDPAVRGIVSISGGEYKINCVCRCEIGEKSGMEREILAAVLGALAKEGIALPGGAIPNISV